MKIFTVGGFVRDALLNLEPHDRDYVIVGATASDVKDLIAQGFKQVGADFPVFLHPNTGAEYALARTERKVGAGYKGFEAYTSPDLTIEDDLLRRDFTMNAMALDEHCNLVDPFGGREDLKAGIIRHVSPAFAEDPLRVLRAARFVARFGFKIHKSTLTLMTYLVSTGELDFLARERVWVELEKILNSEFAAQGVKVLRDVGALQRLFSRDFGVYVNAFTEKKFNSMSAISKFAVLAFGSNLTSESFHDMKVPSEFVKGFMLVQKMTDQLTMWSFFKDGFFSVAEKKLDVIIGLGLLNNRATFDSVAGAFWLMIPDWPKTQAEIDLIVKALKEIDCGAIAAKFKSGDDIASAIREARVMAIELLKRK